MLITCSALSQTRRTVDLRIYRGDVTTVQFRYNGDLTGDSLTFVVKVNKDLSSPRLINKTTADTSGISVWYSAPYSTINVKLITQDTEDLTRTAYVYDLKKDTSTTLYDGAFTLYPAVQSRFDGTNLPGDGVRVTTVSLENAIYQGSVVIWDSTQAKYMPITLDSLVALINAMQ